MADYEEDNDLLPRAGDSDAIKEMYININDCVRAANERGRRALRDKIDLICLAGMKHRVGRDGFDDDVESLFIRYSIQPASERRDGHPGAYWRPFVRLHIAPMLKYYDDSSHPSLIANIANACWAFEELHRINHSAITKPSEGILHPELGEGSVMRFSYVPYAWKSQEAYTYDSSTSPTRVPPPDLYPPPVGKAPIGTSEEGLEAGRAIGKIRGIEAGKQNGSIQPPEIPVRSDNGRPWSEVWRTGYARGFRSNAPRWFDITRGEIEGKEDARRAATEHVRLGKSPLNPEQIQPEPLGDRHGKSQSYDTAYVKAAVPEYMKIYTELKVREDELLRKTRAAAEERARKAEEESKRKAAEAEERSRAAARRADQAEKQAKKEQAARRKAEEEASLRRKAEIIRFAATVKETEASRKAEEEAKRRTVEAEERARREAEARRKAEAESKRLALQEAERQAEANAAAARERDEKHKQKIRIEIVHAFVSAGIPRNYSELALSVMQKGMPHIKIAY